MKSNPAAKVYADSLFKISQEKKVATEVGDDIQALVELFNSLPEFEVFLSSPSVKSEDKIKLLHKHFQNKLQKISFSFFGLLLQRGRFMLFRGIVFCYKELLDAHLGNIRAICSTAVPMEDGTVKQLEKVLSNKFAKKNILLTQQVQPDLLGGFVLEIDGRIVDASLKRKLNEFQKRLRTQTNAVLNR